MWLTLTKLAGSKAHQVQTPRSAPRKLVTAGTGRGREYTQRWALKPAQQDSFSILTHAQQGFTTITV